MHLRFVLELKYLKCSKKQLITFFKCTKYFLYYVILNHFLDLDLDSEKLNKILVSFEGFVDSNPLKDTKIFYAFVIFPRNINLKSDKHYKNHFVT